MFTANGEAESGVNCPFESTLNPLICDVAPPLVVLDTYTNADGVGGTVTVAKVAVTVSEPLNITLQLEVPEQAPVHELNMSLDPADSLSVTFVPWGKTALQVVGQ